MLTHMRIEKDEGLHRLITRGPILPGELVCLITPRDCDRYLSTSASPTCFLLPLENGVFGVVAFYPLSIGQIVSLLPEDSPESIFSRHTLCPHLAPLAKETVDVYKHRSLPFPIRAG